jgi:4-hydroxy-4-methyl-2-oxoglutarate aldolase
MSSDSNLITTASAFDTATLHEAAGKIGALPWEIKPVSPSFRLCGPAVTVDSPGGDNLWIHRALYTAREGDVLVVNVRGVYGHGYWGEIMSTAAKVGKLAGLVIDGCVRDGALLTQIGFPVFARGLCIRGTGKDFSARAGINEPISIGDVPVNPGDLIVGDLDGVVCLPRERAPAILEAAAERSRTEQKIIQRLQDGESTLTIYGWNRSG